MFFIDFRERGRREGGKERDRAWARERERSIASCTCPDQTHNLGICPDPEPNPQIFGAWDEAPTNQTARTNITFIFK